MIAEAIIENNEMKIFNFPVKDFTAREHWTVNVELVEKIIDNYDENDFISLIVSNPMKVCESVEFLQRDEANAR